MDRVDLLLNSLQDFYKNEEYMKKIVDIMNKKSDISRRLLDWFVTNYSKKYRIFLNNNDIDVYQDYKLKLKSFGKVNFDPFCRETRVKFQYDSENKDNYIETSPGQLCFFKWCLDSKILDYVKENVVDIKKDMKQSLEKSQSTDKTKRQYSVSISKSILRKKMTKSVKF